MQPCTFELRIGASFNELWRRPLCISAVKADGKRVTVAEDSLAGLARCYDGRVLSSRAVPHPDLEGATEESVLQRWQRVEGDFADPDEILEVAEYFPVGPVTRTTRSFLHVHLREPDLEGNEVVVVRSDAQADHGKLSGVPRISVYRPLPRWQQLLACVAQAAGSTGVQAFAGNSLLLSGVRILRAGAPQSYSLFDVATSASSCGEEGGFFFADAMGQLLACVQSGGALPTSQAWTLGVALRFEALGAGCVS